MWFCGYSHHRGNGQFKTVYHKGQISPSNHCLMYVCTPKKASTYLLHQGRHLQSSGPLKRLLHRDW
jgi:hypothetical protein